MGQTPETQRERCLLVVEKVRSMPAVSPSHLGWPRRRKKPHPDKPSPFIYRNTS
jgi:hypothetical protein